MINPVIDDFHVIDQFVDNTDSFIKISIIDNTFPHDMLYSLNRKLMLINDDVENILDQISLILNQGNLFNVKWEDTGDEIKCK